MQTGVNLRRPAGSRRGGTDDIFSAAPGPGLPPGLVQLIVQ